MNMRLSQHMIWCHDALQEIYLKACTQWSLQSRQLMHSGLLTRNEVQMCKRVER